MADHADRLATGNKVADKADGRLALAQIIGIDRSARQDEGVVVASRRRADGPLRWAAVPILDQVADELEGTGVGLLLTDARGQVVDRRAADTGILTRLDRIELALGFVYSEDLRSGARRSAGRWS